MPKLEMETFFDFYKSESVDRVILELWTETVEIVALAGKYGKRESCVWVCDPGTCAMFRGGVEYLGVAEEKKIDVI